MSRKICLERLGLEYHSDTIDLDPFVIMKIDASNVIDALSCS